MTPEQEPETAQASQNEIPSVINHVDALPHTLEWNDEIEEKLRKYKTYANYSPKDLYDITLEWLHPKEGKRNDVTRTSRVDAKLPRRILREVYGLDVSLHQTSRRKDPNGRNRGPYTPIPLAHPKEKMKGKKPILREQEPISSSRVSDEEVTAIMKESLEDQIRILSRKLQAAMEAYERMMKG